ncbi:MAG: hypothetical protein AB1679_11360 [Actinomycetota bacterium]
MNDLLRWARNQWDRVLAAALLLAGLGALAAGWLGASNTPYTVEQLPYIVSGAAGGIFLLGVAVMLWLSADLRDEWRKLDAIERKLGPDRSPAP